MSEYCAGVAVQLGLTLAQVCEHSLPQLELLAAAATRDRSALALLNMQTNHAAIAACVSQPGHRHFTQVQTALEAGAEGGADQTGNSVTAAQRRRNRQAMAAALLA